MVKILIYQRKTLENNRDGTFTLELSVEGAIEPEQQTSKANVLIVYDVSGSMSENTTVYTPNETGRYGKIGNSYEPLRYKENGNNNYPRLDNDNYTGTVYYRTGSYGNYEYHEYTGTRYVGKQETRSKASEATLNEFAKELLSYNKTDDANNVEMALVTFSANTNTTNNTHIVKT